MPERLKLDDQPFDPPDAARPHATRPRDAATLILVRGRREVLMGQRAAGACLHARQVRCFLAAASIRAMRARRRRASSARIQKKLLRHGGVRRAPRAFGLAAVRETKEEAGLTLGGAAGPEWIGSASSPAR